MLIYYLLTHALNLPSRPSCKGKKNPHTHTHKYIYIYIFDDNTMYWVECKITEAFKSMRAYIISVEAY